MRCRSDKELTGFPVVMKNATEQQLASWKELQNLPKYGDSHTYNSRTALLWEVIEKPKPCVHKCNETTQQPAKETIESVTPIIETVIQPIATKKQVTPVQTVKATFSNNKPLARWDGTQFVTI